ncbi:MAG TPA: GNAT family N-acetyltransferase [Solirubrobacterales bacterium]|nr:GNAT family N-acetyltransferase [Solirubrobacterales bacterium]
MSATIARAELIADRGEAASDGEFFRSRPFLDAEAVTHTLRLEGEDAELLAPLIVRDIPGTDQYDAVSPYGYPGLIEADGIWGGAPRTNSGEGPGRTSPAPPALDSRAIDFSATGLVSVFLRHTLGPSPIGGATERNVVQIADPALPPKSRPSDRRQVRRNLEAGYALDLVPGPQTSADQRAAFLAAYEQTMRRTGAADHYFFGAAYFDRILEADRTWLALATAPSGEVAAASIAAASDGCLHYYLSGSTDSHLGDSPMKNVVSRLIEHSAELGLPLNLGGGIRRGDALEEFKRGFANRQQPWLTSELVCDPEAYAQLSAGRDDAGFFPAYRA